ncbi:hypothetical protein F8388_018757 [Cannabis sativa]|uniref:Uncharacterized protein n=1 Tax=Cannabis sativa TaxID=3483 RepID=A0A7J6GM60_CANSA|nr:hypothetical protein F8388_018757 [Cannabis sativa]
MRSTKPALQTTRKTPTQQGRRRSSNLSSALGTILPIRNSATTITIASLNPDTSARLVGGRALRNVPVGGGCRKIRRLSLPPPVSLVPALVPTPKTIPAHHPRRILGGELRWLRTLDLLHSTVFTEGEQIGLHFNSNRIDQIVQSPFQELMCMHFVHGYTHIPHTSFHT